MASRFLRNYLIRIIILISPTIVWAQGDDYIWVGGSGNWSDEAHWSSTNGGIPGQDDNVYFNSSSFSAPNQSVNIDVEAFCYRMDWTGATNQPILTGTLDFHIFSSIVLSPELTITYSGNVFLEGTGFDQSITTEGVSLNSNIYFEGMGIWSISGDFDIGTKNIYLNNGSLNTLGYAISCGSFYSTSANSKALKLEESRIEIRGLNGVWEVNDNLYFIKDESVIEFVQSAFVSTNMFDGGSLSYHHVVFRNNATIKSSNSFDNLYLQANCDYEFEGGNSQTIYDGISARGCAGMINIYGGSGIASFIHNNSDINISFVSLNSIEAESNSGYSFNAWHSIDKGNNSGCNISPDSRDMYWINSSGNWSDTTHWTSTPFDEDADCVPVLYDNVNFNNASFDGSDTVFADIPDIECNNMSWTDTYEPVFMNSVSPTQLFIHGSLTFSENLQNQYDGIVFFKDSLGGKQITTSNHSFIKDLYFDGSGGSWTLSDSLKTNGSIVFLKGLLNSNDNFISCATFHSDSSNYRTLNLGSSHIEIQSNYPYPAWSVNNLNFNFHAGSSVVEFLSNSPNFYNYGGDTIRFNDVLFSGARGTVRHNTYSDIYGEFRKVTYNSNAYIVGNNSFDTLSCSPGNLYELASGSKQTIQYDIYPSGVCDGPILIQSKTNGNQAQIKKTMDTLKLDYTAIRDILVSGGASFIAQNSIDLGNNSGWDTISVSAPGKLYWVNDEGDWNDPMHWDTISGGPGGNCIPTPFDIVVFDENSFSGEDQNVTIRQNNAFAHDIDWSEANYFPEFAGDYSRAYLRIYGSLLMNPEMSFTFPGYIYFGSIDEGETIETSGVKFHNVQNNVYFDGIGGEWTLIDTLDLGTSLENENSVYFYNGFIKTDGQDIICHSFQSPVEYQRILDLSNSTIYLYDGWYVHGDNLTIVENTSNVILETGDFEHTDGGYAPYNNVDFISDSPGQSLFTDDADSTFFNNVSFESEGKVYGTDGSVWAHKVVFADSGKINASYSEALNVYSIDSLIFNSNGYVYGDDTIAMIHFSSFGLIEGRGEYEDVLFENDGYILRNNLFDTLTFSPGFSYTLQSDSVQTILDSFNIVGNNCESIYLQATGANQAIIFKELGSVYGDLIEMENIRAEGNALFDAGQFSTDIGNSNSGWIFYDPTYNYNLGEDQKMLEGDTITLCSSNFNGNANSTYEWKNCNTGEIVGTDSCYIAVEQGDYCLTVYYNEGPGCYKGDEIYVGCYLKLDIDSSYVSCYDYLDGWIEINVEIGTDPIQYDWYKDGNLYADTKNIYELGAGEYVYLFKDAENCISNDTVIITQPDSIYAESISTESCFEEETGTITLNVTGGTEPYNYSWSNGSTESDLTGLAPGDYYFAVSDINSCPEALDTITILELPTLDFTLEGVDLLCFNDSSGRIDAVDISGGTGNYNDFLWTLNNQPFAEGGQIIDTLKAGFYELSILDDLGCNANKSIEIEQPEPLELDLIAINGNISLGSIDLTVSGGTLPYEYLWSTGEKTEDIDPLGGGIYSVEVTDGNACKSSGSVFVEVHYRIYAPTAFSPNNDGLNDEFKIYGLGTDLREFELTIFDRWGNEVFKTNDPENYWNGGLNNSGSVLPLEVYTWMSRITYSTGESIIDKGNVSLLK